jgi:phosphodiesterase/alkaline phosphatase D-like protein
MLPLIPTGLADAAGPCDPPVTNPIVCENSKPGNPASEWDVTGAGDLTIQGFATDMSVNKGSAISFKVKTPATNYRMDIYRLGYYGGAGARKIVTLTRSTGQTQPSCLTEPASGLIDCGNWAVSLTWTLPPDVVSGIYVGRLVRADTAGASHVIFIVRDDDAHSDVLFQTADTTWHAYNDYGGNSLYVGGPGTAPGRAYKVSYNRPLNTRGLSGGALYSQLFSAEYPLLRWLEANGYNVSYTTGVDSDRRGAEIREHRVFLSVGHDEYWSAQQRANVEAARNAGVHLAFFSANEVFWKTRWENSIDGSGTQNRTLVSYKETHNNAKIDPNPAWTGTWRDPRFSPPADGGRPENALTGQLFMVNGIRTSDAITVPAADGKMRFWRNTSIATLAAGQTASLPPGTLGYEWDEDVDNGHRPAGSIRLSSTSIALIGSYYLLDHGSSYGAGTAVHNMTLYRHSSGALVFGSGTVQWSWGLDATHDIAGTPVDDRMRQATVNLLADMGVQPGTLQPGLVPATASTDTTAPTSTITTPTQGAIVTAGSAVTIGGTAADGIGQVGGVEVSVDGGSSWRRADGRGSWSYAWTPATAGATTIKVRATDDSGNIQSLHSTVTVTVDPNPVVNFDDRAGQNQPLNAQYPTNVIDWGTGAWWHAAPYGAFATKSASFATSTLTSGTFAFATPRRLEKVDAFNGGGGSTTVSISCAGQTTKTQTLSAGQVATITTGWTGACTNVTLSSTNGWATNFDNITHFPTTPSETTPPVISDIRATSVTSGSAMIEWTTNEPADSQVEYGLTATYGTLTNVEPLLVTGHSIALGGLSPNTTYHYRVRSRDGAGNSTLSADQTFVTAESGASQTVTFDDRAGANQLLNGEYPVGLINWGTGTWYHSGPFGELTTKNLTFNGSSRTSGSFTFVVPRRLVSLRAYNGGPSAATVTINCTGQPTVTRSVAAGQVVTIATAWTAPCSPITLASSNGWDTNFDDLVVDTAPPLISNVLTTGITSGSATITWTTSEPADGEVEYGTTSSYGNATGRNTALVLSHSQGLSGLQPNTTYHYRVKSRDADGNLATSGDVMFTTTDATPPQISDVRSTAVVANAATITWLTNELADSQVEYGTTTGYGSITTLDPTMRTSHSVDLLGLTPLTTYHYRVRSRDSSGNLSTSADQMFVTETPDTTPPVISALEATAITSISATISWTTDENADRQVEYGLTTSYGSATTVNTTLATGHSVTLNGLTSATTYHFRAKSKDAAGNLATSLDATFTTPAPPDTTPPTLSGIQATAITNNAATIVWSTNEPADSQVEFGTTTTYGSLTSLDPALAISHSVAVGGLSPNTTYHYRVRSRDAAGNPAASSDALFTTTNSCPCTIWPSSALPTTPSSTDTQAVELGVKLRSDTAGYITAIRFYKGGGNSGTHVGSLWSATGSLLARATFANESPSGWQRADLSTPVAIAANTTYVASYHAPSGGYARDPNFFAAGVDAPPLHALATGVDGPNGLYAYGAAPSFPVNSYQATNYWVDVVFDTNGTDLVAPEIAAIAATNVTTNSATIVWSSFEAASSQVEFGTTPGYGSSTSETTARVTSHSVALSGLTASTTYHYRVKSRDAAGNLATSGDRTFNTDAPPNCPCTIWNASSVPATASQADTQAVQLGVRFRSDVNGYITGLRFYKGAQNTGSHRANLWTNAGALLATAVFSNETASGWQQVAFSAPVAVTAGTTYVASYHAPNGGYSTTSDAFAAAGVDSPPLHALRDGVTGANGVYAYGPSGTFPINTYRSTNYWVDVVFALSATDTIAPAISGVGSGSITSASASISWTTDEPADSQVEYGVGVAYGSQTSLDATAVSSHSATVAGLSPNTTYHYRVRSRDPSGNLAVSGDFTFTTLTAPPACPCTIWPSTATPETASFADTQAVELGVKFRADVNGLITAIRFYKGSANTGTHVAHLWRADGPLLATATFTGESASGWQQVQLGTPVAIVAGTTYVASYHAPNGGYAVSRPGFVTEVASAPLRALASGTSLGNGVYAYGPSGTFPTGYYQDTNYWVDVVFTIP